MGPDEEDDDYEDEDTVELEEFEPQLVLDIELLENDILERDASSETYRILTHQLRRLTAIAIDALVRYEYKEDQLYTYMFSAIGVRD